MEHFFFFSPLNFFVVLPLMIGIAFLVIALLIPLAKQERAPDSRRRVRAAVTVIFSVTLPIGAIATAILSSHGTSSEFDAFPALFIAALSGMTTLISLYFAFSPGRKVAARSLALGGTLFLALPCVLVVNVLFPELVDERFREFKELYGEIRVGMNRDEVRSTLEERYPESGDRARPHVFEDTESEFGLFMDPEGRGEPNCEAILLDMQDERVVRKRYSAD